MDSKQKLWIKKMAFYISRHSKRNFFEALAILGVNNPKDLE